MNFSTHLTKPVTASFLGIFRILFGLVFSWQIWKFIYESDVALYFSEIKLNFPYSIVWFLSPLPLPEFRLLMYGLFICSFFLAIGLFYRLSAIILFLGWTYIFLLDQIYFNNHFYLMSLLVFILIFINGNARYSVDNWLFPKSRSAYVPQWQLLLLKFQVSIIFFFSGLGKLNADWLSGYPLKIWFKEITFPNVLIDQFFASDITALFFSYGGLLLDLSVAFFLMNRKTKYFAFIVLILFNLSNHYIFSHSASGGQIGVFPFLMLSCILLFIDNKDISYFINKFRLPFKLPQARPIKASFNLPTPVALLLGSYVIIQLLLPLRHFMLPGNPDWTGHGAKFAWRMKQADKKLVKANFIVPNTGSNYIQEYLNHMHEKQAFKIMTSPEMLLKFSKYVQAKEALKGNNIDNIRCELLVQFNGRPAKYLVDPNFNLLEGTYNPFKPVAWLLPLDAPTPIINPY